MTVIDHPSRQCHGKRTYSTRKEARHAITRQASNGGGKLGAYRCVHCGSLHLGTRLKDRARRDAARAEQQNST